ncbi:DUF6436 domain-containing protein [Pseudomonas sp. RP23018S]|uniref:DUF6436 domain-containing protein n=1 Tax=Pseudomonas sp. RP23018S TaxID=3096037 RepID=UPI002ACA87D4|nr:DUF6436 domain-containing protein [Pseudomonas sp. RP23018S]MDZ5602948.1 DUF6436 domain-containing protein [Pseudomonas sp. RP23018S]
MLSRPRTTVWIILLALAAGTLAWLAYASFKARYLRPFDSQTAVFTGAALRLPAELAGPGPIRVVHFWDPACPCNVGNQQHLGELVERYAGDQVSFYMAQKPGTHGQLPAPLNRLRSLPILPGSEQLPASPAVAIWDRRGTLVYLGPYSEGAACTASNSFIEPILDALRAGRPVNATNTLAVGCYCPWSTAETPR